MEKITIYHNPRCSKSRQVLDLLKEHHKQPEIIEYLKTPPSVKQLTQLLRQLNMKPRELMRKGEEVYRTLDLNNPKHNDNDLIETMAKNPILIERPIVVVNDRAILARPPEKVMELL